MTSPLRILIACETSGIARRAFAARDIERDLVRAGASYAVVRSVTETEAILKSWGLI